MAASSSDYFIEVTPGFATTIGAGGVAAAGTTTVPLTSVSGLSTTTAVEVVINRVDSTGAVTNNYETVRGTISGTSLINCSRGVEGTAQAWTAGTVVEYLVTADIQNRMVTGITVGHTQAGLHNTTIVSSAGTMTLPTATDTFVGKATTDTLTNKRITSRVQSVTDAATITPAGDTNDLVDITAIAQSFTIANPSGTPTNGQKLLIRWKDNATARAITWGNGYVAGGAALPTTTTLSKIGYAGFIYNTANSLNKWQCVVALVEA